MSTMSFNTSNQTFRQLLGNGLSYHVPPFRCDYSWAEEKWDESKISARQKQLADMAASIWRNEFPR